MTRTNRQRVLVLVRLLALIASVGLCAGMFSLAEHFPPGPLAFSLGMAGLTFLILSILRAIALIGDAWGWLEKWAQGGN